MSVWTEIVRVLRVASVSHIKKMDLVHTSHHPRLYNQFCRPVLVCDVQIEYTEEDKPREARRICHDYCPACWENILVRNDRLGVLVCEHCGTHATWQDHFSYRMASRRLVLPRLHSAHFSKRLCFMKYWILRIQGKEACRITREELDSIQTELIRENRSSIDYELIKFLLRRLGMQRYYHHVVYIMKELSGHPLASLTASQEQILLRMFYQLQDVHLHRRVNMLSYPYLIRKFCELRGWTAMARVIPMLKSSQRLMEQDRLWHSVCQQTRWRFIPTSRF